VSLQAAIEAVLPELRAEAVALMTSRCTIRRIGAQGSDDEGYDVGQYDTVYTDLPIRLDSSSDGSSQSVEVGGTTYEQATGLAHLPADTTDLADDDLIEVTSGEWPGTFLRVLDAPRVDKKTARRVPVVEVSRPKEL